MRASREASFAVAHFGTLPQIAGLWAFLVVREMAW